MTKKSDHVVSIDGRRRRQRGIIAPLPLLALALWCSTSSALPAVAQTATPAASRIQRVQPGDKTLTCDQIKGQLAEIDQTIAATTARLSQAQDGAAKSTVASTAAITALSLIPIPGLGLIGGAVSQQTLSSQDNDVAQTTQRLEDAQGRRDVLTTLGDAKSCW